MATEQSTSLDKIKIENVAGLMKEKTEFKSIPKKNKSKSFRKSKIKKSKDVKEIELDETKRGGKQETYRNTIKPFIELLHKIKSRNLLKDDHKKILKQLPLWNFIHMLYSDVIPLKETRKNSTTIDILIKSYNKKSDSFMLGKHQLKLTETDIEAILGVKDKGKLIQTTGHLKKNEKEIPEMKQFIERYFDGHKKIKKDKIESSIFIALEGSSEENIKDTARLLMLYLAATFLVSNANSAVPQILILYCVCFEKFKKISWPKTILKNLMHQVKKYYDKDSRKIHACVTILLWWICEKTNVLKSAKPEYKSCYPLAGKWNITNLKSTMLLDLKQKDDKAKSKIEYAKELLFKEDRNKEFKKRGKKYIKRIEKLQKENKKLKKQVRILKEEIELNTNKSSSSESYADQYKVTQNSKKDKEKDGQDVHSDDNDDSIDDDEEEVVVVVVEEEVVVVEDEEEEVEDEEEEKEEKEEKEEEDDDENKSEKVQRKEDLDNDITYLIENITNEVQIDTSNFPPLSVSGPVRAASSAGVPGNVAADTEILQSDQVSLPSSLGLSDVGLPASAPITAIVSNVKCNSVSSLVIPPKSDVLTDDQNVSNNDQMLVEMLTRNVLPNIFQNEKEQNEKEEEKRNEEPVEHMDIINEEKDIDAETHIASQVHTTGIMSHRHRSSSHSSDSPAAGVDGSGPSQEAQRPIVTLLSKASGGFELEPSEDVLIISRKAYRGRMTACWPRWDSIPPHIIECVWQDFLGSVDLKVDDHLLCRNHWMKKMRKNYRDTISAIKKTRKKPDWMGVGVWEAWCEYWNNDEANAESERNSANRMKNPATHRGRSKPFKRYRQELEQERQSPVSYMDVFARTHAIEHENEDGTVTYTWQDSKSQQAHESFMQQRETLLEGTGRAQLSTDEEDAIFEYVMEPIARGRRYSFGNQEGRRKAYKNAQDQSELERVKARLAEVEERQHRCEVQKTQLLDERIAAYMQQQQQQHDSSSAASGDGNDES